MARFAERMIEATPIDVVAEFFPAFAVHDKTEALANFDAVPALVLAGDRDLITPPTTATPSPSCCRAPSRCASRARATW